MKESGQIIIVLLLMMLVGLSIGLVVTQRSVTDVSVSTQSEQSQRAFSAAEAGIEKVRQGAVEPRIVKLETEFAPVLTGVFPKGEIIEIVD